MTAAGFRRLALSLPETAESAHMNHPDFRVKGKIFATLSHDENLGMVKLTPEQQAEFMAADPDVFVPCSGAWGERGCTNVRLRAVKKETLERAMVAAWRNTAPKGLVGLFEGDRQHEIRLPTRTRNS
jgi:hypothetical protein